MNSIRKQLNRVSFPLLVNSLLGILSSLIVVAVIGRISPDAIAVTEVIDGLLYSLIGILGAGSLSFNIYASRVRDSDPSLFQDYFKSILILNLLIGGLASLSLMVGLPLMLTVLYHFSGKTLAIGTSYGRLSALKMGMTLAIFAFSNHLKVKKQSKAIATVGALSAVLEVSLILLALGLFPGQQLRGLALASLLSLLSECGAYWFILRRALKALRGLKSGRKLFLLRKSAPLFLQELLEGTLFSLVISSFLSRLGVLSFASYSLCLVVVKLAQIALFPYVNGLLIVTGEAFANKERATLRRLPRVTICLNVCVYGGLGGLSVVFSQPLFQLLSNQSELVVAAQKRLPMMLVFFMAQLFFEVTKYSLQALGRARLVLLLTVVVNLLTLLALLALQHLQVLTFTSILGGLALNYGGLSGLFHYHYRKVVKGLS